jgi:sulfite reductase alpha subunit-like flavoprotein
LKDGSLTTLTTCFSRDNPDLGLKYVQDCISAFKNEFIKLVYEEKATIYVCGDAKNMAKDVNQVIINSTSEVLGAKTVLFKHLF